jgi:hypothetical protein
VGVVEGELLYNDETKRIKRAGREEKRRIEGSKREKGKHLACEKKLKISAVGANLFILCTVGI